MDDRIAMFVDYVITPMHVSSQPAICHAVLQLTIRCQVYMRGIVFFSFAIVVLDAKIVPAFFLFDHFVSVTVCVAKVTYSRWLKIALKDFVYPKENTIGIVRSFSAEPRISAYRIETMIACLKHSTISYFLGCDIQR